MFESLTLKEREPRRVAQPVLSFAIHAGLIALAVGRVSPSVDTGLRTDDPIIEQLVIVDRDAPRARSEVKTGGETPLPPAPVIVDFPVPGPVDLDHPAIESIPGPPVSKFLPGVEPSILDPGQPGDPGVYSEGDLSDSPVLVHFPDPVYPPALRAAGVEGVVQVTYVIDTHGDVEKASIIIVSTDQPSMAESVRSALGQARFRPGKLHGSTVRTLVRQTIRFSLMSL
jgi:TonB family protein